jgi:hypothetical protein
LDGGDGDVQLLDANACATTGKTKMTLGETHVVVPISLMQQISKVLTDYAEDAEESGQLNAIVREIESLLGVRPEWTSCADLAMPSSRKSRRNL